MSNSDPFSVAKMHNIKLERMQYELDAKEKTLRDYESAKADLLNTFGKKTYITTNENETLEKINMRIADLKSQLSQLKLRLNSVKAYYPSMAKKTPMGGKRRNNSRRASRRRKTRKTRR